MYLNWPGFTEAATLLIDVSHESDGLVQHDIALGADIYQPKDELHVTVIGSRAGRKLVQSCRRNKALMQTIVEIFEGVDWVYQKTGPVHFLSRTVDGRVQKSIILLIDMPGMSDFYQQLRSASVIGPDTPTPPPHITLYTFNVPLGIAVPSYNKLEEISVRGITCNKKESKITICSMPDKPGVAAYLFKEISKSGINVDTIVQNVSHTRHTDISFTVPTSSLNKAIKTTKKIAKKLKAGEVMVDKNIARVSIVGSGMRSHHGIAARMFQILADNKVNIEMIATSEISISCIISRSLSDRAVKALHRGFKLSILK